MKFIPPDGKPIVNSRKSITINISDDDVRQGKPLKPDKCAAALACRRLSTAKEAHVYVGRTYVKIGDKWVRFLTPQPLAREITALDRGGRFAPGEYTLGKIKPSGLLGKHQGGPQAGKKGAGKKRDTYHLTGDIRRMSIHV